MKVKSIRTRLKLTQMELAAALGVSQSLVARIEGGGLPVSANFAARLQKALDAGLVLAGRNRRERLAAHFLRLAQENYLAARRLENRHGRR